MAEKKQDPTAAPAETAKQVIDDAIANKQAVINRIYDELDRLVCGTRDSGQLLCLEFPARPLNYRQYQYDTSSRTSVVSKPYTISEAEFRLTDDLFDVAPIVQGPSGQKLSVNYLALLNNYVPRLADVAEYVKDKAALRAWLSRDQTLTLGGKRYTGSIIELSKQLYSDFLHDKERWEREKSSVYELCRAQEGAAPQLPAARANGTTNGAPAGTEAALERPPEAAAGLEGFAKWLSAVSPVRDQQLNSLFNDAVVRGYYHEVLTCLGFLNVASPSELLETTKQNARNSARRSLDESMDVYPVQLQPNNWFEAMTPNLSPKDLTMAKEVLLAQFKGKLNEMARLREYLVDLKSRTVSEEEIKKATEAAERGKADVRKAEVELAQAHGAGALSLLNVVLKARPGILARSAAKKLGDGDKDMAKELGIDKGLDAMLATYQKAQGALDAAQRLAELEARRADTTTHDYKAEIAKTEQRIKDMEGDLRYLETLVGGAYEAAPAAEGKKEPPPVMPAPVSEADGMFMDVSVAFKRTQGSSEAFSTSSSASSRFNVSGLFFSVGGQRAEASAASEVEQHALSSSFQLGFRIAKVTIDRGGWFNPALFTMSRAFYRLAESVRAGPADRTKKDEIVKGARRPEGLLPAYPVAFIVAKDITIRIEDKVSAESVSKAMKETSSSIGGGFLCFSASHASAGRSTAESTYHGAVEDYYYIRIPGPQIIGWILQQTDPDLADTYSALPKEALAAYTQEIVAALAPAEDRIPSAAGGAAARAEPGASGNGKDTAPATAAAATAGAGTGAAPAAGARAAQER